MKRMVALKKMAALIALGGATFSFGFGCNGFPFFGGEPVANANLVAFYQQVGGAGIEAVRDGTANAINNVFGAGNDFNPIVVNPLANFVTGIWNNGVAQNFPQDPAPNAVFVP